MDDNHKVGQVPEVQTPKAKTHSCQFSFKLPYHKRKRKEKKNIKNKEKCAPARERQRGSKSEGERGPPLKLMV